MRFDIVLNNLAGFARTTKEIKMMSDGTPWRPLIHVEDICQAIILALQAPRDAIHNQVFNVGDDNQNYQIREIATVVGRVFEDCAVTFGKPSGDNRSYRTSFGKIKRHLPAFRCQWSAESGARQLREVFEMINMNEDVFSFRAFTRVKQLSHLIATRQIDPNFYWRGIGRDGRSGKAA
jgi:nucleoside-diphosphate-sugar epimerase